MLDEDNQPLDDSWFKFRLETRNVVGDNDWKSEILLPQNPESAANTRIEVRQSRGKGKACLVVSSRG